MTAVRTVLHRRFFVFTSAIACAFFLLFLGVCVPARAETPAPSLDEEFAALQTYRFGMSRLPLARIGEAVRVAATQLETSPDTAALLEKRLVGVLDSEADPEAKRFACRMLGEIGADTAVGALAALLQDEVLFHAALTALENIPGKSASGAIAAALEHADPGHTAALLFALGRQGHPDAIPLLISFVADSSPDITVAAVRALAARENADACRALAAALQDMSEEQAGLHADACLRCAGVLHASGQKNVALGWIETLQRPGMPTHVRTAALNLRMRLFPEEAESLMLTALQDEDPRMAAEALAMARLAPGEAITNALLDLLDAVPAGRRPAMVEALAARENPGPEVAKRLVALVNGDHPETRQAALAALGKVGTATHAKLLLERASDGPVRERRIAHESLARLKDPAVDRFLLDVATDRGSETIRCRAIAVLADRRAASATKELLSLAEKAPAEVRSEALRALRILAPPEMLPHLATLYEDAELDMIRDALIQAFVQTAERARNKEQGMEALLAAWKRARTTPVKAALLETAGLIGGESAFSLVRENLRASNPEERRAAVTAMERIQDPRALDDLNELLRSESDSAIRSRAYAAYAALLRSPLNMPLERLLPHITYAAQCAATVAEKRDWLAMAAQLPALTTLRLTQEKLQDAEIAAEARPTLAKLGTALLGAYPEAARAALQAVLAQNDSDDTAQNVRHALAVADACAGTLLAWDFAGPYMEPGKNAEMLFAESFQPQTDPDAANWRILPFQADADPPCALDLGRILGGEQRALFLRARIAASVPAPALLRLGTNDGCKVWWNGSLVLERNVPRSLNCDDDTLEVQLQQGDNSLQLAVFQHGGAWSACVRLLNPDGTPLQGVTVTPGTKE